MAKSCSTLLIALFFCLFTLSLASHAPADNDEASHAQVALLDNKVPVNSEKQFNAFTLTEIPFNRRFLALPKFPCRQGRIVRPTFTSYGNDMIFPSGEMIHMKEPVIYGGGRRIPGRWLAVHHRVHGEDDGSRIKKTAFKRHVFDKDEDKLRILKKLKKHFVDHDAMMEKKGRFMRGSRKFLDHYFNFDV